MFYNIPNSILNKNNFKAIVTTQPLPTTTTKPIETPVISTAAQTETPLPPLFTTQPPATTAESTSVTNAVPVETTPTGAPTPATTLAATTPSISTTSLVPLTGSTVISTAAQTETPLPPLFTTTTVQACGDDMYLGSLSDSEALSQFSFYTLDANNNKKSISSTSITNLGTGYSGDSYFEQNPVVYISSESPFNVRKSYF